MSAGVLDETVRVETERVLGGLSMKNAHGTANVPYPLIYWCCNQKQ